MNTVSVLLIAVSLAMDAFAVSVSNGISITDFKKRHAVEIATYFGVFQMAMPLIGYIFASFFANYIEKAASIISFVLLCIIGGKMVYEALKNDSENIQQNTAKTMLKPKRLIMLAIATSIDALAVGISFSLLKYTITVPAIIIGIVAFITSFLGCILGKKVGSLFQKRAEIIGGVILILIGIKMLF